LRAAPTYHDDEEEEEEEEEQEQDARSYAGDDMADMHLHDHDDFLSRRVVLREEQHNEVIFLSSSSLQIF
jgi:ABC-type Zn2+ transport system substrate-binding protein/surface adhesin